MKYFKGPHISVTRNILVLKEVASKKFKKRFKYFKEFIYWGGGSIYFREKLFFKDLSVSLLAIGRFVLSFKRW